MCVLSQSKNVSDHGATKFFTKSIFKLNPLESWCSVINADMETKQ